MDSEVPRRRNPTELNEAPTQSAANVLKWNGIITLSRSAQNARFAQLFNFHSLGP